MTTPTPSSGGPAPAATPAGAAPSGSRGTPGAVIGGRYTLQAAIGAGGMGAVWKAHDDLLQRDVAIKEVLLPPGIPADERDAIYQRTLREARAAAGLAHPSVVRVYDVITDNERPWIVMELLTARSLADMISRDGPLPPRAIAKIGLSVLGALEAAHRAGVLHRDVKPANVLICSDGRCILTDFGVARIMADNNAALTTPGMVLGSPQYISPERATGSEFGPPSDLFSLGVTLYAACQGRPPFDRGDPLATMHAVVYEDPEPPHRAGPLAPALLGMLAKDPRARSTIEQTREALRDVLAGPLSGAPTGPVSGGPPALAGPISGGPVSTQPASGPPVSGQPMPGPVSAQPMPGQPMPAQSPPGQPVFGQPAGPVPGAVPPGAPMPPTGRPVPQQPVPMRATAQVPSHPAEPAYDEHYAEPVYGARPPRRLGPWLVAGGAAVVVLILVLVAVGGVSGWFGGDQAEDKPTPTAAEKSGPSTRKVVDPDGGYTSAIPKSWVQTARKNYLQYADPDDHTAWIRFNTEGTRQSPAAFLKTAWKGLKTNKAYSHFHEVGLHKGLSMGGQTAARIEYTLVQNDNGQHRHALWEVIVVDGTAYEIYMSVPQARFTREKPAFERAVKKFTLT